MASLNDVKQYAQFLHNAAPREFVQFRDKFKDFSDSQTKFLLEATDNLMHLQGMAKQAKAVLEMLKDIK